jgi:hypothetical protein
MRSREVGKENKWKRKTADRQTDRSVYFGSRRLLHDLHLLRDTRRLIDGTLHGNPFMFT